MRLLCKEDPMKQLISLILCLLLAFPACALAQDDMMQVVNCSEWVSLRKDPDSDSVRLLKVPLGAVVEDCTQDADGFIRCSYNGFYGFILSEYLAPYTPAPEETQDDPSAEGGDYTITSSPIMSQNILDVLPDFPSQEILSEAGTNVLTYEFDSYTVMVQRAGKSTHETLRAVCYDENGTALWQVSNASDALTELTQTYAFIAGTAQDPLLVIFVAGKGFHAYDIGPWSELRWQCVADEALAVSGGLSCQVDAGGNIYACGFSNSAPICIGPDGSLLWAAQNLRADVYNPWKLELSETGLNVYYNELTDYPGICNVASYDMGGNQVQVFQQEMQ